MPFSPGSCLSAFLIFFFSSSYFTRFLTLPLSLTLILSFSISTPIPSSIFLTVIFSAPVVIFTTALPGSSSLIFLTHFTGLFITTLVSSIAPVINPSTTSILNTLDTSVDSESFALKNIYLFPTNPLSGIITALPSSITTEILSVS